MSALTLVLASATLGAEPSPPLPAVSEFNRDVRPTLSYNCSFCHDLDQGHRQADSRLDVRDAAEFAKAIVPGKVQESDLIARIVAEDQSELMPPPNSNKQLTQRQKDIWTKWIEHGAEYEQLTVVEDRQARRGSGRT